ncbi:DsbC family protein [Azospirillum sp. sgz302134]
MRIAQALAAAGLVMAMAAPVAGQEMPPLRPGGIGGEILGTQQLPGTPVTAVESSDLPGLAFLVGNGRFVIVGRVFDTWGMKEIKSLAEVRALGDRLDLSALKLDFQALGPLRVGTGPQTVRVFVDPKCPYCHRLMEQMAALSDAYTFELLVIPVLGEQSKTLTREISCATNRENAIAELVSGKFTTSLEQAEPCDLVPIQKRLVTAQILGVSGVPMTIAPDGRVLRGYRPDLGAWLDSRS